MKSFRIMICICVTGCCMALGMALQASAQTGGDERRISAKELTSEERHNSPTCARARKPSPRGTSVSWIRPLNGSFIA